MAVAVQEEPFQNLGRKFTTSSAAKRYHKENVPLLKIFEDKKLF